MGLIRQLRPGMDLSKVTLPTFILEPRSFLEKMTDFLNHAELFHAISTTADPEERIIAVVRWYLSGWHIRPKGVKKPYNPILGELFRGHWTHPDGSVTKYLAEQVSHHPPITTALITNRKAGLVVETTVKPKSSFSGNSSSAILQGQLMLHVLGHGETYKMSFPSAVARGIIVGTMLMETVGKVTIEGSNGLRADLDFKAKGWLRGEYNTVAGKIYNGKTQIAAIDGKWDSTINITRTATKEKSVLFSVADSPPQTHVTVPSMDEQDAWDSRKLWAACTAALIKKDYDTATAAKTALEDDQRAAAKARKESGAEIVLKNFHPKAGTSGKDLLYEANCLNISWPYDPATEDKDWTVDGLADGGSSVMGTTGAEVDAAPAAAPTATTTETDAAPAE